MKVFMWRRYLFIVVIAIFSISSMAIPDMVIQSDQGVAITSPVQGDVLSGVINIFGNSEISGFKYSDLAFSYAVGSMETWFPISESSIGVEAGLLFVWDTTLISDGDYRLRLRVFSEDNSIIEFVIPFLSIRNNTPILVPSPSVTSVLVDPSGSRNSPTVSPVVRPTKLPDNPLELSSRNLALSAFYGFLSIFGLILISIIYSRLKRQ
ncbi:MAG: hypothetical protein ABIJ65_14290 [Chloroflexota bacterium]